MPQKKPGEPAWSARIKTKRIGRSVALLALAGALPCGCGGASGPSSSLTPGPVPSGSTITLSLAIQQTLLAAANERAATNAGDSRVVESVPALLLGVPDPYLKAAPRSLSLYAMASLEVPPGSIPPSTLPALTWRQKGNRVRFDTNPGFGQNATALGAILVGPPATPGVTKIFATAPGAGDSEIDAYAYRALGIVCVPGGLPGSRSAPQGVAFDAQGRAQPAKTLDASDIALTGTGCAGSFAAPWSVSISVPHGSTRAFATTSAATSFTSMTAQAFADATTLVDPGALSVVYAANTTADKLLFKTRDGRLVKFLAVDERFAPDRTSPTAFGPLRGLYGFYAVSSTKHRFAF
jgi:hypothetical protein